MSGRIIYGWVPGRGIAGIDSQSVGEELGRIHEDAGELTPTVVLKAARRKRSPLHDAFEWDDAKAAEDHRLWQARYLIGSVIIRSVEGEDTPPVRAFVSVAAGTGREYVPTVEARSDPFLREQILERACSEALAWRRRYSDLAEFAGVVAVIDETVEHLRMTG